LKQKPTAIANFGPRLHSGLQTIGRQLALKISANAIYGFTGAPTSKLRLLAIAEVTLKRGAEMLGQVRDLIQYAPAGCASQQCSC